MVAAYLVMSDDNAGYMKILESKDRKSILPARRWGFTLIELLVVIAIIRSPSPSEAMTFVDESIETVDDGYFAVNHTDRINDWQNSPTVRHGKSGVLAFADGHSDRWRWLVLNVEQGVNIPAGPPNNTMRDLQKVQQAVLR